MDKMEKRSENKHRTRKLAGDFGRLQKVCQRGERGVTQILSYPEITQNKSDEGQHGNVNQNYEPSCIVHGSENVFIVTE